MEALFAPGPTVLITDSNVGPLYAAPLKDALEESGWEVTVETIPAGETSKSWSTAGELLERVVSGGLERGRPFIGLGGGVVGDLTGFVSSTYLRGAPSFRFPLPCSPCRIAPLEGRPINHGGAKTRWEHSISPLW